MNNGLYSAFLGMRARQRTLDLIANNIANASTTGFKADRGLYRSIEAAEVEAQRSLTNPAAASPQDFPQAAPSQPVDQTGTNQGNAPGAPSSNQEARSFGVLTTGMTDFSTGSIRQTGGPLDIALAGNGFLAVQTSRGERYTRAGALSLDNSGQLVTQQGDLVIGESGPITLPQGEVSIGEDGTISVKGQTAGRLKLVDFSNPSTMLIKEGASLFMAAQGAKPTEATQTRVLQGTLETSNVNPMSEMALMMQNNREFDSLQRSMSLMREIGRRVTSEIGKI